MSAFNVKASSPKSGDMAQAGSHPAVLVAMVDLGTHEDEYQGKKSRHRKAYLVWELTAEASHQVIGRDYTISFAPKAALRGLVEKWRGRAFAENEEFDLSKILGKPCLLTVVHGTSSKGNPFAKIDGVSPVPKGMPVPPPSRTPFSWEISGKDLPAADWLPFIYGEAVTDVIRRSEEYRGTSPGGVPPAPLAPVEDEFRF